MTPVKIIVKIILIIQFFLLTFSISMAAQDSSPAPTPTENLQIYESNENKGMGKIMRLNLLDQQVSKLTQEVALLKKEVEELKARLQSNNPETPAQ